MKYAYPIIITKEVDSYIVSIPDFDIGTQGKDIPDAMCMARDAIGLMGIDLLEEGKELPLPHTTKVIAKKNDIVTLVDIDFEEYRKKFDNRAIKKNCTIPFWLNKKAEEEGINFSRVLQEALITKLNIQH